MADDVVSVEEKTTKKTRTMSQDMLDKLALAREKASAKRKENAETKRKQKALLKMQEEEHAQQIEQQYRDATKTVNEPVPTEPDCTAIAPIVHDGPAPIEDPIEAPIEAEAAAPPPTIEIAPAPVEKKRVRIKAPKAPKAPPKPVPKTRRRPKPPPPQPPVIDDDQEAYEEPIVSHRGMPPNVSDRTHNPVQRLEPPRGAPFVRQQRQPHQQTLYRPGSMRNPYAQVPQGIEDEQLEAYERAIEKTRNTVAYNSMFPTHSLERALGHHRGQSQYGRY